MLLGVIYRWVSINSYRRLLWRLLDNSLQQHGEPWRTLEISFSSYKAVAVFSFFLILKKGKYYYATEYRWNIMECMMRQEKIWYTAKKYFCTIFFFRPNVLLLLTFLHRWDKHVAIQKKATNEVFYDNIWLCKVYLREHMFFYFIFVRYLKLRHMANKFRIHSKEIKAGIVKKIYWTAATLYC